MTQEEKDILLEKMLDPDGVMTDAELEKLFQDDELKEIYEVASAVRGACVQPSKIDVKQEWRLFRHRILPRPSRWRWTMRVAAIFLGVMFASAIVKIAIDRILTEEKPVVIVDSKGSDANQLMEEDAKPRKIHDVENNAIPTSPVETTPNVKTPKRLEAKKAIDDEEIDVDEYLRLQQARIDNDMALLQAEIYIAELQALREAQSTAGDDEELEQHEVRYAIMQ